LRFSLLCYTSADFTPPQASQFAKALGILSNFLDSVLPVLVIFALEISGLRQLCCRFFLSPLIFLLWPQLQTRCSPSALSANKKRANKSFIF